MQITRIKPGGWVIILLLLAAIIYGVRSCGKLLHPGQTAGGGSAGATGGLSTTQAANGDILVSTTGTKQKWMQAEIDKFNGQSQAGKVSLQLAESRDAMHGILDGKLQPTLWSPSSPVWVYQLANVWPGAHGGAQIADLSNSQSYRVLFKSPLVFLTTKEKAPFLRPLLTGPNPWDAARQLSLGQKKAPWGAFHFAYADPLNASSGMLTMALIITDYTQSHHVSDPVAAASSSQFAAYLSQINRAFVRDPSAAGSSALEKAYTQNPSSRDFITAYENAALNAVANNPDLVLIYAALAQVTPMPAKVSSGITQAPTTNGDLLDTLSERIGDGRAYRLTRKGVDPIVCTLQGRTDTSLIVSQCHFHIVKATLNAKTHQVEAPPWAVPPVFYTELSDEEALKMLETEPRRFTGDIHYGQRGIFATHFVLNWPCQICHVGDSIKIAESDVAQVEYINLPASALPADLPPESPMPPPNRVNPSVFSVWPPTEQPSGISTFQRKRQ